MKKKRRGVWEEERENEYVLVEEENEQVGIEGKDNYIYTMQQQLLRQWIRRPSSKQEVIEHARSYVRTFVHMTWFIKTV